MQKKNICHRDIKTSNIMLHFPQYQKDSTDKEKFFDFLMQLNLETCDFTVKLADFGVAKEMLPDKMTGTCTGTPLMMDPDCLS
jgi:serine/threonine protein kinase